MSRLPPHKQSRVDHQDRILENGIRVGYKNMSRDRCVWCQQPVLGGGIWMGETLMHRKCHEEYNNEANADQHCKEPDDALEPWQIQAMRDHEQELG